MPVPRAGLSPKSHCSTLAVAGNMQLSPTTNMKPEVVMTRNVSARRREKRARWSGVWRRSIVAAALALMATTAVGACASGHSHRGGGEQQIIVHLTNDLTPPSDVTVYAVSEGGIRRLLGEVPPNKDRALKIPSDIFPGTSFRIVAERTGGRPVVSQPITATSGTQMIDWDLQTNSMWFPETAG
jgi:hypothetical protein